MAHGHAHEEAEHAEHHSHDPFDKRVALTMVVIAALLAAVKLLGHRTHNEVLAEQIEADTAHTKEGQIHTQVSDLHTQENQIHTQVSDLHTQESDLWNLYQAQRLRFHLYNIQVVQKGGNDVEEDDAAGLALSPGDEGVLKTFKERRKSAADKAVKWKQEAEKKKKEAEEKMHGVEAKRHEAEHKHHDIEEKEKEAEEHTNKAERAHHRANYLDAAELFVEIGLVICSVAILIKRASFWYGGMAVSAVGLVLTALAYLVH